VKPRMQSVNDAVFNCGLDKVAGRSLDHERHLVEAKCIRYLRALTLCGKVDVVEYFLPPSHNTAIYLPVLSHG
jgi:hypothetical protein